jgi:hypothetical protein
MNNSTADVIGRKDMAIILNIESTVDRFENPNSALLFTNGYATVPPGVYFDLKSGGFTIMVWVKLNALSYWQRILDFGQGENINNVFLAFQDWRTIPVFYIKSKNYAVMYANQIQLNNWYHIALSMTRDKATFYVNGIKNSEYSGKEF